MSMPDEVPVSITDQRLRETEQLLREAFAAAAQSVTPTAIHVPRPADRPERSWSQCLPWGRRRPWDRRRLPRLYEQVLIPLAAAAAAAGPSNAAGSTPAAATGSRNAPAGRPAWAHGSRWG